MGMVGERGASVVRAECVMCVVGGRGASVVRDVRGECVVSERTPKGFHYV